MSEIIHQFHQVLHEIRQVEKQADREPESVKLLVVSKTWSADKLRVIANEGQHAFGENYLQEALQKIQLLADMDIEWHFIGPIQSNKTRDIANHFQWVQTIERSKIAKRLSDQRPDDLPPLNICIQINIDAEKTKAGIAPETLLAFADEISRLPKLQLRGLMIIPEKKSSTDEQIKTFQHANELFETLKSHYPQVDTLSMGMSGDMQAAIEHGSTIVRIGTAIFGERHTRKS